MAIRFLPTSRSNRVITYFRLLCGTGSILDTAHVRIEWCDMTGLHTCCIRPSTFISGQKQKSVPYCELHSVWFSRIEWAELEREIGVLGCHTLLCSNTPTVWVLHQELRNPVVQSPNAGFEIPSHPSQATIIRRVYDMAMLRRGVFLSPHFQSLLMQIVFEKSLYSFSLQLQRSAERGNRDWFIQAGTPVVLRAMLIYDRWLVGEQRSVTDRFDDGSV